MGLLREVQTTYVPGPLKHSSNLSRPEWATLLVSYSDGNTGNLLCAPGSSMSGEKYQIKFGDRRLGDSATLFRDKRAAYPGPQSASHSF